VSCIGQRPLASAAMLAVLYCRPGAPADSLLFAVPDVPARSSRSVRGENGASRFLPDVVSNHDTAAHWERYVPLSAANSARWPYARRCGPRNLRRHVKPLDTGSSALNPNSLVPSGERYMIWTIAGSKAVPLTILSIQSASGVAGPA